MTLLPTFLGFSGRIGRLDFWLGGAAASAFAWLCAVALTRLDAPAPYASAAGDLVFLALFMGVAVKRGNDRGHSPADTLGVILAVVAAGVALAAALAMEAPAAFVAGLTALAVALTVLAVVDLGFMLPPDGAEGDGLEAELDATG